MGGRVVEDAGRRLSVMMLAFVLASALATDPGSDAERRFIVQNQSFATSTCSASFNSPCR